jgi:RNA polymerase sigma factor (sigma-70 family)
MSGEGTGSELERSRLDSLGDEELVDLFLSRSGKDRQSAHLCFEVVIARYQWLINHVVRSSRFRFPAWDSSDDVISRAIFKVYRGLSQWRRQGKLSSFIARITTSEMIDTIRRVNRDKTWEPPASGEPEAERRSIVESTAAASPSPETQAAAREQRHIIGRLLADICRDWKDTVIVSEYIINSVGARDIADKYGISEDLVYQRARRLRVRLVKGLTERGITSAEQLLGGASQMSTG